MMPGDAVRDRRSRAGRLGWIRRKRRDELQAAIAEAIDELRNEGFAFFANWPSGKTIDREAIGRILYWNLAKKGVLQAEKEIGYEALGEVNPGPRPGQSLTL